jgi:hypothetical protein
MKINHCITAEKFTDVIANICVKEYINNGVHV